MTEQPTDVATDEVTEEDTAFDRAVRKAADDEELRPLLSELARNVIVETFAEAFITSVAANKPERAQRAFTALVELLGVDVEAIRAATENEETNESE
jgi:hypothetical protein